MTTQERNEHFEHLACLIWASAEGCIDYPHLDRLALPAPAPASSSTIQERIQAHEEEAAAYQANMTPQWTSEDAFFRHLNECNDGDCTICCPVADDDGNYLDDDEQFAQFEREFVLFPDLPTFE